MRFSTPPVEAFNAARNSRVPERAMVPRFSTASARLMPMPLSTTVSVRASASRSRRISYSAVASDASFTASKRRLSMASEAFEISSRRKISLCE